MLVIKQMSHYSYKKTNRRRKREESVGARAIPPIFTTVIFLNDLSLFFLLNCSQNAENNASRPQKIKHFPESLNHGLSLEMGCATQ